MINDQERIRELLDTPSVERLKDFYEVGPVQRAAVDEFVELIIRECALLCVSRPGPGDDIRSREHCAEQIREHFGVK